MTQLLNVCVYAMDRPRGAVLQRFVAANVRAYGRFLGEGAWTSLTDNAGIGVRG